MKFYANLKFLFKTLKGNFLAILFAYIIFPICLSFFLSSSYSTGFDDSSEVEIVPITIVDNDNSRSSDKLIEFVDSSLNSLVQIVDSKDEFDLEIIIPKGYEDSLVNKTQNTITINDLSAPYELSFILQTSFNNYHEIVYLNSATDTESINEIFNKNALVNKEIEITDKFSSHEYYAVSTLGLLIVFLLLNTVIGNYLDEMVGFNKRLYSLPVTRVSLLLYNSTQSIILSFILLATYTLIYRGLGVTFTGNLFLLLLIVLVASIFMTAIAYFLVLFFGKNLAKFIVYSFSFLQFIIGGFFTPMADNLVNFYKFSPLFTITEMFNKYNLTNNFSDIRNLLIVSITTSALLYLASIIKEKYSFKEI